MPLSYYSLIDIISLYILCNIAIYTLPIELLTKQMLYPSNAKMPYHWVIIENSYKFLTESFILRHKEFPLVSLDIISIFHLTISITSIRDFL